MLNIYEALQQNLTHLEKFPNFKSRSNFLFPGIARTMKTEHFIASLKTEMPTEEINYLRSISNLAKKSTNLRQQNGQAQIER
jgi:hypothetical protein